LKVIGITGGIGSGKSFVSTIFSQLGIPVYDADTQAKLLMVNDRGIVYSLIENFGKAIYTESGSLNRKFLSDLIFTDDKVRLKVNSIVHPAVAIHFEKWQHNTTP